MALQLHEAEHIAMLRDTVRRFLGREVRRQDVARWDRQDTHPKDVFARLSELGVNGLTIPEQYGGSGRDIVACMAIIEELSRCSMAIAVPYIMCTCYAGMNIVDSASEEQKRKLLPAIARGQILFAYGLTEPDVGADLASVRTTADRKGDRVVVNGAKRFCSGAGFANYIYTLVRSDRSAGRRANLSFVLIPPDAPGVTIVPQHAMGLKGTGTTDVSFDDVELPFDNVVGGEAGWNNGWQMLIGPALDTEKLEVSALALGIAEAALDEAWEYSTVRTQFGKAICTMQSIRHMLADARTRLYACRQVLYQAASLANGNIPCGAETSMAKLFVCDTARDVVLACQQVMGAYGYVADYNMERYVRDILVAPIFGGSSAIQRNNIANALGLPR